MPSYTLEWPRRAAAAVMACLALCGCERATQAPSELQYASEAAAPSMPRYRIDILPQYTPAKIVRLYQPLIDHVNRQLGIDAQLEMGVSPDFKTFEEDLKARTPDFILGNPWHTIKAIDVGYHVIAMAGVASDFRGLFVVRKDSPVRRPADLKGKTVSYPSPTALAAGMMPQWFLHEQGVDVGADIRNIYVGSQDSSIMSVYLRQSDAGATWPPPWRQFQVDYPKEAAELKVVWQTAPLVNNGVLARDDVPLAVREHVKAAVTRLHETAAGRRLLEQALTDRFYPAADGSYEPVRRFMARFEAEVRPSESR